MADTSKLSKFDTVGGRGRFFPGVFHWPWLIEPYFLIVRSVRMLTPEKKTDLTIGILTKEH